MNLAPSSWKSSATVSLPAPFLGSLQSFAWKRTFLVCISGGVYAPSLVSFRLKRGNSVSSVSEDRYCSIPLCTAARLPSQVSDTQVICTSQPHSLGWGLGSQSRSRVRDQSNRAKGKKPGGARRREVSKMLHSHISLQIWVFQNSSWGLAWLPRGMCVATALRSLQGHLAGQDVMLDAGLGGPCLVRSSGGGGGAF